ncbi:MAG: hypothetical protein IIT78_03265, partial [Mycoplasmataceae bacterium]|nr:hypothetical protein [Mycoplasmataceae bacterium]
MKNRRKKVIFTYIGISVLAIITPITIVCGASYHANKIANSKRINTTINRVQKVPNFVNANLFQNTDYDTSKITIGKSNTWGSIENSASSAFKSFLNQLNLNLSNSNLIPQNIDWTSSTLQQNTNINGALSVWIQSYCSSGANSGWQSYNNINCSKGNISNSGIYNFQNNKLTYQLNNFYWWDGSTPWWFSSAAFFPSNYAPLNLKGKMWFSGISPFGNINFTSNNSISIFPAPIAAWIQGMNIYQSWPHDSIKNKEFKFGTNSTWTITLPFNMQKIQSNIQNAISNISLSYYEFKPQWKTGLVNQINQRINGCIPSYMSNCFVSSSNVTTYGATGGQINTTVTYIDGQGKSIPWHFTTTVTMPAQPSDESAYNLFKKEFSQPITLFSNTSNVWDSNKYWNSSTVPVDISSKPKTSSYIKTNNNIYYNGNLSTNNSTWCTNKAVLVNYINMIFELVENEIKSKANTPNPDPFSNNPISLSYSFITTQNETHEIQTKLTFKNNDFNNVSNINSNYKNSPWIFDTAVSLSLTTFYYSGSILNRINIQALPMPVAGSFQLEPDNGYLIKGSNQT